MAGKRESAESVMGHRIPPPQLTLWAWGRLAQYLLLPFFGALFLLDLLFYLIFRYGFDSCYGVLCLLE